MDLNGASVLLTGASTGIGAATARALGSAGARIGIVARRQELLEKVAAEAREAGSPDVRIYAQDLGDLEATARLGQQAWDDFGGLDGLVNNAAVPARRHVKRLTSDELEMVMRVNFRSPVQLILEVLPKMLERGGGTIINVASMGGRLGIMAESAYCAAKFALTGFTEVMYIDLKNDPVNVHVVQPGPIDTPIWDAEDNEPPIYTGPWLPPEVVADEIVATLKGERGFEIFAPADYKGVADWKNSDVQGFLDSISAQASATPGSPAQE
jgi:NAD(P)-dependent dehydrogenase (short-subunit alcohol dehydrogenase family)